VVEPASHLFLVLLAETGAGFEHARPEWFGRAAKEAPEEKALARDRATPWARGAFPALFTDEAVTRPPAHDAPRMHPFRFRREHPRWCRRAPPVVSGCGEADSPCERSRDAPKAWW